MILGLLAFIDLTDIIRKGWHIKLKFSHQFSVRQNMEYVIFAYISDQRRINIQRVFNLALDCNLKCSTNLPFVFR